METPDSEIITYMLKSLNKIWLNDFDTLNKLSKTNNIPSIVWKGLFHMDIYVILKFPNCDKQLISNISHFWLISLTTFLTSKKSYSTSDIYNYSKIFLTDSFNHFKLLEH